MPPLPIHLDNYIADFFQKSEFLQEYLKIGPKYTKNTTNLQYNLWDWKWPPRWQYWLNCLLFSCSFSSWRILSPRTRSHCKSWNVTNPWISQNCPSSGSALQKRLEKKEIKPFLIFLFGVVNCIPGMTENKVKRWASFC